MEETGFSLHLPVLNASFQKPHTLAGRLCVACVKVHR